MDKVRELGTFYKVVVAFGFTFLSLLILFGVGLLIIYIIHLVNYYKTVKEKKKQKIYNLEFRVNFLEHKISEHDKFFAYFAKGTTKKEKK